MSKNVKSSEFPRSLSSFLVSLAEAEAAAAAGKVAVEKVATNNKKTISCRKGKVIKKVTAVNPKCPPGYKKK